MLKKVEERLSMKCRDMEDIFKRLKFLEVKKTISEMKNTLGEIYDRVDTAEEKVSESEDIATETIQNKAHRENKLKERKKKKIPASMSCETTSSDL